MQTPLSLGGHSNHPKDLKASNPAQIWYPRPGITTFLLHLAKTTELVVLNLIPQHDPYPDSQLAGHGCLRFFGTFLD